MRFQNMEQMWGYPHVLSHEGLRIINEFAEAELTAMVIKWLGKTIDPRVGPGGSHRLDEAR